MGNQYHALKTKLEGGPLLAHGYSEKFKGEFSTLGKGADSIINRMRGAVLENTPSPVVMQDKNLYMPLIWTRGFVEKISCDLIEKNSY